MKQKLFENIGGNQFKLISENVDKNPNSNLVREGLKKIFSSADGKDLLYKSLANIGMGYIKDVSEARKCALQEARQLAEEFGYKDDESNGKFVKGDESLPEKDSSNPKEVNEVRIGKEILNIIEEYLQHDLHSYHKEGVEKIKVLANELVQLHGSK